MKIKGREVGKPKPRHVIFPRADEDVVFTVRAVTEDCPIEAPKPKVSLKNGQVIDDDYNQQLEKHNKLRVAWLVVTSMDATEDLEWERVDINNPETWELYQDELRESGMTDGEIGYLIEHIGKVNTVDEEAMEAARDRFFRMTQGQDTL